MTLCRLQQKATEGELSRSALYENGIALVVAGSETTATLLTGCTYFLCRNPEVLKKVQAEVRSAFENDSEITLKSVNDLTYMLAVLSESLRIYPPSPFGIPRRISTKPGQKVAGQYMPYMVCCSPMHLVAAWTSADRSADPRRRLPSSRLPLRAQLRTSQRVRPGTLACEPAGGFRERYP